MNLMRFDKFSFHESLSDCKLDIVKQGIWDWPISDGKITSQNNFKLRFSESSLDLVRDFSMTLMRFDNFGPHGYSSDCKLNIVKQGMWDWSVNDVKMTSHNNFKLRFSGRSLHLVTGFLFQFGVISEIWLPVVII